MREGDGFNVFSRLAERTRRAVVRLVRVYGRSAELVDRVRAELLRWEPRLAAVVTDAQILGYVRAAREVLARPAVRLAVARPVEARPLFGAAVAARAERFASPIFPQVATAAQWLADRVPYTPEQFAGLDADARRVGFTVARAQTLNAVRAVQTALAEDVAEGGTLNQFRGRVADALEGSAIGPGQVEALYRTHVGRAYSAGQVETLDNPAVRSAVPYLFWSATHDGRTRPDHLAMETAGLDGTAIYRADDPIFETHYPPAAWNCRCVVITLDVETAAEMGVKEAREWKRTGRPPAVPQFVGNVPLVIPPGWVPTGRKLTPLV